MAHAGEPRGQHVPVPVPLVNVGDGAPDSTQQTDCGRVEGDLEKTIELMRRDRGSRDRLRFSVDPIKVLP